MRRAAAITVLVLIAATLSAQYAWAAVFVGQTNLTIHVSGSSVTGKLVGRPECRPDQPLELLVDGAVQSTTTTDGAGNYTFTGSFSSGSSVQTSFGGSQAGLHPDRFDCTPALSRYTVERGQSKNADSSSAEALQILPSTAASHASAETPFIGRAFMRMLIAL